MKSLTDKLVVLEGSVDLTDFLTDSLVFGQSHQEAVVGDSRATLQNLLNGTERWMSRKRED